MHSKLTRAKARRTIKDTKHTSWRQYVNKLNSKTPVKKIWDMIRKVIGKNKKSECIYIKSSNSNKCYPTEEISNALGENFQKKLKCNDTAPDDIHYHTLKHLHALETLFNIMNEIWSTGNFPEEWHKANYPYSQTGKG